MNKPGSGERRAAEIIVVGKAIAGITKGVFLAAGAVVMLGIVPSAGIFLWQNDKSAEIKELAKTRAKEILASAAPESHSAVDSKISTCEETARTCRSQVRKSRLKVLAESGKGLAYTKAVLITEPLATRNCEDRFLKCVESSEL